MISKLTKTILPVLLLMTITQISFAQSGKENPITTAVPFLRLAADARTGGMGDVGVATNPDANSMFYNGSKTAFNDAQYGIGLTYTPWLSELDVKNLYQISLSSFYKLNDKEAISFGVRNFSMGTFMSLAVIQVLIAIFNLVLVIRNLKDIKIKLWLAGFGLTFLVALFNKFPPHFDNVFLTYAMELQLISLVIGCIPIIIQSFGIKNLKAVSLVCAVSSVVTLFILPLVWISLAVYD